MTDSAINADLKSITDLELRDQLQQWLISQDFTSSLQSKLRKDLYESFAKTTLGRRITLEQQKNQQITFSPMIMALNTLVAEFLYSQNCHYSLSVFVSETPHKSSLPNFENHTDFRFSSNDINEIFSALGLKSNKGKSIQHLYETIRKHDEENQNDAEGILNDVNNQSSVNTSLLYCLFQYFGINDGKTSKTSPTNDNLDNKKIKTSISNKENKNFMKKPKKRMRKQNKSLDSNVTTATNTTTTQPTKANIRRNEQKNKRFHHTQKITKYLKSMSHNLVRMTKSIGKLAIVDHANSSTPTPSPRKTAAKLIHLSQNLGKISQNMKKLYQSIRKNKNFTQIFIPNLTKMTEVMKICEINLEKLTNQNSINTTNVAGCSKTNRRRQAPSDDCLNCDNGTNKKKCREHNFDDDQTQNEPKQNFDLQIELEQQKNKMNLDFSVKLQQMRTIMKLYYKQKMLEKYRRAVQRAVINDQTKKTNEMKLIDGKINDILFAKQQQEQPQQQEPQQQQPQQQQQQQLHQHQQQQPHNQQQQHHQQQLPEQTYNVAYNAIDDYDYIQSKQELSVNQGPNINISPIKHQEQLLQQEKYSSSNELLSNSPIDLGQPKNFNDTYQIRSRLAEIESEGERLENSLKELKQYHGIGLQLDSNAVDIWKTYNLDRQLLLNHSNQTNSNNNQNNTLN